MGGAGLGLAVCLVLLRTSTTRKEWEGEEQRIAAERGRNGREEGGRGGGGKGFRSIACAGLHGE